MQPAATEPQAGYFDNLLNVRQATLSSVAEKALKQLSDANNDDVKAIAASQIELLSRFYDLSLSQAGRSFHWALIASMVGLVFFLLAIAFMFFRLSGELSIITMLGGALIEFIAGVNFYLYGKTLSQLTLFQGRLEVTQRFLLANSLCESLGEGWKDKTRARLINQLTTGNPLAEYVDFGMDATHNRSVSPAAPVATEADSPVAQPPA